MTLCHRCGLQISTKEPRSVINDKVYHLYCKWKLEQQAIRNISDSVNPDNKPKDETKATPLHWVSQQ